MYPWPDFCELPDPNQCDIKLFAEELRDILCIAQEYWNNEVRVVPIATPEGNFNSFFAGGTPAESAIVVRRPDEVFYTDDFGTTWTAILGSVAPVDSFTNNAVSASNIQTNTGFITRTNRFSFNFPVTTGQLFGISLYFIEEIVQFALVTNPVSRTKWWVNLTGPITLEYPYVPTVQTTQFGGRHVSYHEAPSDGTITVTVSHQFEATPPPNGDPDKIWRSRIALLNYSWFKVN